MADYLIHFNRNHNRKTGRFDFGDGDGDGIRNDHANQKEKLSFEKKIHNVAKSYDKMNRSIRKRALATEQYKVDKGDLRRQQAEISKATTSAKTDEKRDKVELAQLKKEARSEDRLRAIEERRRKAQLEAEKKAAKHEEELIKRQMLAEKRAERLQRLNERRQRAAERRQREIEKNAIKDQKKYENAQRRAERAARAEYKRRVRKANAELKAQERNEAKRKSMRSKAIVAACMGMPITALTLAAGSTMSKPSVTGFVAKNAVTSLGTFNNPILAAPFTIASNVSKNR